MSRQNNKMGELVIDLFTGNGGVYLHRFVTCEYHIVNRFSFSNMKFILFTSD